MRIHIKRNIYYFNSLRSKSRQSLLGIFEQQKGQRPVRCPFYDTLSFFKRTACPRSLLFINNIGIDCRDDCGDKDPRHQNRKRGGFPGEKDADKSRDTAEDHQP